MSVPGWVKSDMSAKICLGRLLINKDGLYTKYF